jgi:phenylacetate-coenzyme A ligase PaaK-like adenylate-forming protein
VGRLPWGLLAIPRSQVLRVPGSSGTGGRPTHLRAVADHRPRVACECVEARAGLHVNEDHFLVEAVDPDSGRPLPPGERGELVVTP